MQKAVDYATQNNIPFSVTDHTLELTVDEHAIAQQLSALAHLHIIYTHISITKPNLEDYFLEIARQSAKETIV